MWVIERYINSELAYWDGETVTGKGCWTKKYDKAIKFADADSAARILAHHLDSVGRVVQHDYIRQTAVTVAGEVG